VEESLPLDLRFWDVYQVGIGHDEVLLRRRLVSKITERVVEKVLKLSVLYRQVFLVHFTRNVSLLLVIIAGFHARLQAM
jgi:hypothetical protein